MGGGILVYPPTGMQHGMVIDFSGEHVTLLEEAFFAWGT